MRSSAFAKKLLKDCKNAKNVAISGHINPDYDALGSCLSMQEILRQNDINADIILGEPLDNTFEYLRSNYNFVYEIKKDYDVLIMVDTAEIKLIPEAVLAVKEKASIVYNIDHHQSNKQYADNNFVQGEISSANEVIYYLFKKHFELTKELASFFYIGIYADTGGFVYSNTKERTFLCLADLISTGLDADALLLKCFRSKTKSSFEMTKKAFDSVQFYANGSIVVSQLKKADFEETGALLNESKFIISYLPTIENVKVAICASEPKSGEIHISLRTSCNDVDVSKIAKHFGGGGHIRASGLTLKGDFDKALKSLINYTKYVLENGE